VRLSKNTSSDDIRACYTLWCLLSIRAEGGASRFPPFNDALQALKVSEDNRPDTEKSGGRRKKRVSISEEVDQEIGRRGSAADRNSNETNRRRRKKHAQEEAGEAEEQHGESEGNVDTQEEVSNAEQQDYEQVESDGSESKQDVSEETAGDSGKRTRRRKKKHG